MAIFKTRKHNDYPTVTVVELYTDAGVFVDDAICDTYDGISGITTEMSLLMNRHYTTVDNISYHEAERLI